MSKLKEQSLASEAYREYDFQGRIYRIENPGTLYYREGGSTHRITTYDQATLATVVHCVPAPGTLGCVLRWVNRDSSAPPCEF